MRTDANKISLRALRSLLAGARPFELDVAGKRVTCSVAPRPAIDWPAAVAGLDRAEDGPDWPSGVSVDCAWAEGRCRLEVDIYYWSSGRYLHDLCIRVRTERGREVVFGNVSNEVEKLEEDVSAKVRIRFFLTKRKSYLPAEVAEALNDGMRDALQEARLPILGDATAELCEIEVPSGSVLPSPEAVFRRLVHLALLKLDFIDRKRTRERGAPLVDLSRWLTAEQLQAAAAEEPGDTTEEEEAEEAGEDRPRQYWAGGFTDAPRLERFIAESFWKIGWPRDSDDPAAKRTWKRFARLRVGDYFAIKGYGGTHDLSIRYVGEVTKLDPGQGRLELRQLHVPLYKGKGPRNSGAGNWHDTLVPVERPDVIKMIFGGGPPPPPPPPPPSIPLNLILFGPPGTGKTYRVTRELVRHFQRTPTLADSNTELAEELTWHQAVAIALHELGGKVKVATLEMHPLIKAMYATTTFKVPLRKLLWGTLQRNTVGSSKTVNYKTRSGKQLFDKDEDSMWWLATSLPEELRELAQQRKTQTSPPTLDDFTFVTFHQAYSYEDFIEGIRPNIEPSEDDEETSLSYRLEDGAFMKASRAALRIAGYDGSLHDFCGLAREQREAQFRNAPPYAIFIDEINRGNVARIFGELITLLEKDKRLGADSEVIVQLPYSKKRFGVPPNLYVIGTMNTADRSIEALDTALRRRFEFEELPPRPDLLQFKIDGDIDPAEMLRAINRRLEKLYDRDHCIGHAYLTELEDDATLDGLKRVFRNKLLPLLQEYFFGDWGKIGLVLGKDFVRKRDTGDVVFADFEHDDRDLLAARSTWELADLSTLSNRAFQRIYRDVPND